MLRKILVTTALAIGLTASSAMANTITVTSSPVVTGAGPYTWTYSVTLTGNSQITAGDFFSIFDFAGYVAGTIFGMPGWAATTAPTTVCNPDVAAICPTVDDPTITNLTFTYGGAPITNVPSTGTTQLGNFGAQSIFDTPTNDFFTSQDDDLQTGCVAGIGPGCNEGALANTNVPVAGPVIPEPASLILLGSGLLGLARARARRRSQK